MYPRLSHDQKARIRKKKRIAKANRLLDVKITNRLEGK